MATERTCAASFAPSSASIVTVAGWPLRTLTTSDSERGTTSCIEERSLSTAKEELEEPEPELEEPVPEAAEAAPKADAAEEDPVPEESEPDPVEPLVVPLAETASPTSPESETMVPVAGARSFVSDSASSALCTARRSLLTAARAEAMLASRAAALSVALTAVEPEPDSRLVEELPALAAPDFEDASRERVLACSV